MHHVTPEATILGLLGVLLISLERPGLAAVAGGLGVLLMLR